MKNKKMRNARKLIMTALFLTLCVAAFAQGRKANMNPDEMVERSNQRFEKMLEEIPNLTSAQEQQLTKIHERYQQEFLEMQSQREKNRPTPDERESMSSEQKKAQVDIRSAARAQMQKRRIDQREEMKSVLTPEQITFLQEKREERQKNGEGIKKRRGKIQE